jgi:ElaB/YqjD/DUF883 family membrane-anchored ribosome-binding protein
VDEAHVEHAVGFVEHEVLHLREVAEAALGEVDQPARRRDQDVAAGAQAVDLRALADAAEDHAGAEPQVGAVVGRAVGDLRGELTRRRQHQRARRAPCGLPSFCSSGSTKPAVLPVPVWAPASTSRPESTAGIACSWMGVGVV